ncbi:MAG: 2Fe-2S iron-sulfur cluster binding domain-containing protein, partial [Firmicutes bacterium]|nr:2Fe-2S iron-sulfur cluster binding domain-containing protein [Bacillota bacterium]
MPEMSLVPQGVRIQLQKGETVFQALVRTGYTPDTPCGGNGTCGKCRVRIHAGPAGVPNAQEKRLLDRAARL